MVLAHGFASTREDVASLAAALTAASWPGVWVHVSTANEGVVQSLWATSRGVAAGAAKLVCEVEGLVAAEPAVTRLSLLGHSLGGLFCRAAAPALVCSPALLARGVSFATYASFATPHAGLRNHLFPGLQPLLEAGVIGQTGVDLTLSAEADGGVIGQLAGPAALAALARFDARILVALVADDDKVPFASAALVAHPQRLAELAGSIRSSSSGSGGGVSCHFDASRPGGRADGLKGFSTRSRAGAAHPAAAAASSSGADGEQGAVVDMTCFPHVVRVVTQAAGDTAAAAGWEKGGAGAMPAAACAFTRDSDLGDLEAAIISRLRQLPWTNVDVAFEEFPAYLLNHFRIIHARPYLSSLGEDVVAFFARHCFVP